MPKNTHILLRALQYPLLFVITLLLVHIYGSFADIKWSHLGIYPREIHGLKGIFSSVFIHGSWKHLFNNSIPLLVLGTALFYFYRSLAVKITLYSILYSGLLLWLGGRPSFHIGASGLVYALASFLFFSGFIRKHNQLMALSMCVVFLYGGLVWGIFPTQERISWEGHLFGAINGLFWAVYFKKEGPQRRKYSWEIEEELLQSLEGIEVIYEEVKANEPEEDRFTINYVYKKRKAPS